MHKIPVDPLPGVKMHKPALHSTITVNQRKPSVAVVIKNCAPRPFSATPAATDPRAAPPDPPSGKLGVVIFRIALQPRGYSFALLNQPQMASMQVALVNWPVGMLGYIFRSVLDRAPEIAEQSVRVV
jgi:hypothetical protein